MKNENVASKFRCENNPAKRLDVRLKISKTKIGKLRIVKDGEVKYEFPDKIQDGWVLWKTDI